MVCVRVNVCVCMFVCVSVGVGEAVCVSETETGTVSASEIFGFDANLGRTRYPDAGVACMFYHIAFHYYIRCTLFDI